MPDFECREVLACPRIDEVPIPSTPSFNCECEQCGARIWVAHSSPIEPVRMCVSCSAAHDKQSRTEQ
jgi:predicted nucleic acid-binding Zn ribbon protein